MATDTVKIMVTIEWHGKQRRASVQLDWWDKDNAKDILDDIMHVIGGIE